MTRDEFLKFQVEKFDYLIELTKKKNADYAGDASNAFSNFTRVEELGVGTTEQGFLTRMTDKLSRLISFHQNGELQVKDESVEDTLLDLANYCVLMAGYLESKRESEKEDAPITSNNNPYTAYNRPQWVPPKDNRKVKPETNCEGSFYMSGMDI